MVVEVDQPGTIVHLTLQVPQPGGRRVSKALSQLVDMLFRNNMTRVRFPLRSEGLKLHDEAKRLDLLLRRTLSFNKRAALAISIAKWNARAVKWHHRKHRQIPTLNVPYLLAYLTKTGMDGLSALVRPLSSDRVLAPDTTDGGGGDDDNNNNHNDNNNKEERQFYTDQGADEEGADDHQGANDDEGSGDHQGSPHNHDEESEDNEKSADA